MVGMHSHIFLYAPGPFHVLADLDPDLWWRREKLNLVLYFYGFLCNTSIFMFVGDKVNIHDAS